MPKFKVHVVREYTAHHTHVREVEAENKEAAMLQVEDDLDNDVFDPTDEYTDSSQEDGYDRAYGWSVDKVEE
jgi:hypothetical protein